MISPVDYLEAVVDTWCVSQVIPSCQHHLSLFWALGLGLADILLRVDSTSHLYSQETILMASKLAYCNCYKKKSQQSSLLQVVLRYFHLTTFFWMFLEGSQSHHHSHWICAVIFTNKLLYIYICTLNSIKKSCRSLLISPSPTSTISGYCEAHALPYHWMGWVTFITWLPDGCFTRLFGMCC